MSKTHTTRSGPDAPKSHDCIWDRLHWTVICLSDDVTQEIKVCIEDICPKTYVFCLNAQWKIIRFFGYFAWGNMERQPFSLKKLIKYI